MMEPIPVMDSMAVCNCLNKILHNTAIGIFVIDGDRKIIDINDKAYSLFGLKRETISNSSLSDIESILNIDLESMFDSVQNGNSFACKNLGFNGRDNASHLVNIYFSPIDNADYGSDSIVAVMEDFTEFKIRNEKSERAERELSILWQVSEALSQATDIDRVLKIILTGVTANQGLGFNRAYLFLTDDSCKRIDGEIAVGPASPEEAGRIWSELEMQDRSLSELLSEYLKQDDESGFGLSQKIKDYSLPNIDENIFGEILKENKPRTISIHDSISDDSRSILNHLGTDNLAVAPIVQDDQQYGLIAADNHFTGNEITDYDIRLLHTLANYAAVAIEKSKLYDGIIRHNLELEEKNAQLKRTQEQLVRIEKMSVIGELTSSIAHELRNPLTVIGGFANLILSSNENNAYNEYLNIIVSEAQRAEAVLGQVLDFSRASRNANVKIELNGLIEQTYEVFSSRLKNSVPRPEISLADNKAILIGNPDQLQHAFYQFMNIGIEETVGACRLKFTSSVNEKCYLFEIGFVCNDSETESVKKSLKRYSAIRPEPKNSRLLSPAKLSSRTAVHSGSNRTADDCLR